MKIEYDPAKDAINRDKHGLSLSEAADFDFEAAVVLVDDRFGYGETRYRAFARSGDGGFSLAFAVTGQTLRPISYRRAHDKELRHHGI